MYKFDDNNEEETESSKPGVKSLNEATQDILGIIVRISGLLLLFIGLWIAIQVFSEALALYKDPSNIERIAIAIEESSNIDKSITPIRDSILGDDEIGYEKEPRTGPDNNNFRLSYFIAWVVVLLLLMLLARLSIMAIKTGGELALYDAQVKQLAKQIIKANRKK